MKTSAMIFGAAVVLAWPSLGSAAGITISDTGVINTVLYAEIETTTDTTNVIVVSLAATFAELPAGNYTVSILATSAGGSTDSAESNVFALPLA